MESFDLENEFIVLDPDKNASRLTNSPDVFERLHRQYGDFKGHELVSCFSFEGNWSGWERHPHGDEIVLLLSGQAVFILDIDGEHRAIPLSKPGRYLIVPKGVWHTAQVKDRATVVFITPGEGTEHTDL